MKKDRPHHLLFNKISSVYGLFYRSQRKSFSAAIANARSELDITAFKSVLDVGSGTGALCSLLHEYGIDVIGIEPAEKMREVAIKKTKGLEIPFNDGNILNGLPFENQSFDIVLSSYVAHGLSPDDRQKMYREMRRLAKEYVIFHDFNQNRSLFVTFIEWLEGSDYVRYIKTADTELRNCKYGLEKCFHEVKVIKVATQASWYICKVNPQSNIIGVK